MGEWMEGRREGLVGVWWRNDMVGIGVFEGVVEF